MEEARPPLLPSRFPRRRRSAGETFNARVGSLPRADAVQTAGIAPFEWTISLVALFVLGRLVILFLRRHLSDLFGGPPSALWQDDLVITLTFASVEVLVVAVGVWRARASALLRQPALLLLLGWAWLSTAWSVEPAVTMRRVLLFAGAAGVGWFVGDRFPIRDHVRLVSMLGGVAAASTVIGAIFWNETAKATNGLLRWSGIYVNSNALGLVLAMGFMASMILIRTTERKRPLRVFAFALFIVLALTSSRTPFLAAWISLGVVWITHEIRRKRGSVLRVGPAAYVVFATLATIGLVVHWYWYDILRLLGRSPDLTGRTLIWQLVRWFSDLRPWTGWGFEAIWANRDAIGQAQAARGSLKAPVPGGWPFSAHSGYYELMVGIGWIGLLLMIAFLVVVLWRAFRHAWLGSDVASLWPLAFIVFALVVNFSESLFVSSEALWAITVATAVALREHDHRQRTSVPLRERGAQLLRLRLG